jgi:hypothetical protein
LGHITVVPTGGGFGGTTLLIIAGWTALSVVTVLGLLPLLRMSRGSDAPGEHRTAVRLEPSPLRESGYFGIVLERLVLHACTIFDADEVCVFGRDPRRRDEALVLAQGAGVNPDLIGRRLAIEWDPMVAALACGRPLTVPGELWPAWQPEWGPGETHSAAIAPIWFGGRVQGALSVIHRRAGLGLDVSGLALLGELAELVGQVLAHTEGRQLSAADPQREIDGLLATLARIEPDTGSRGAEVAGVARWLADDIGLGGPDRLELELAARLNGVGKLRVPSHVLQRTAELTRSEQELLLLEPLWGAEMIARIPGLETVALIVRFCRESWDGRGYPDGLAGEQIPLASRIIALSEAFSSMTARRALDPDTALRELGALAGSIFDPDLTNRLARSVSGAEVRHPA